MNRRANVSAPTRLGAMCAALATLALTLTNGACTTWSEQLTRAEVHYQAARYEAALVNLEDIEPHWHTLSPAERVRYLLVRGRSHLRLDQRRQARYWLSLTREAAASTPDALSTTATRGLDTALSDLDGTGAAIPEAPVLRGESSRPASATP